MTPTELQFPTYPSIKQLAEHLSLRSLSSRTREEYLRYIRKLAAHCGKDPATLAEHEARAYLLYLKEQKHYAPSSMRIATAALRFFFNQVLGQSWRLFSIVRTPDKQRLPIVLSREEVRRLLGVLKEERFRVILQLIYSCGLRVGEAVKLEVWGWGRVFSFGAPVKRASTRVKVPSVQLDGSAPKTAPTASPQGGVGSRRGVEPTGRNEHMNHINEPRKSTPGSRAPRMRAKAAESEPGSTVVGSDNGPAGSAWATCREVTLG